MDLMFDHKRNLKTSKNMKLYHLTSVTKNVIKGEINKRKHKYTELEHNSMKQTIGLWESRWEFKVSYMAMRTEYTKQDIQQ